MQPGMSQSQLNQGNQLRSHLGQFAGAANSAMFTAAQASSNSQMVRYHFLLSWAKLYRLAIISSRNEVIVKES
jgi:hypothetical protein